MEKNRETFMKECWDQYLATQDIQFLIDAVEEAPFFGQKEMAMEISRLLKKVKNENDIEKVSNSLVSANKALHGFVDEEKAARLIDVLNEISNYLFTKHENINTRPLLMLGAEITNISNGVEPKFIRSHRIGKDSGAPVNIEHHLKKAAITALIEILMLNEEIKKPSEARKKLSVMSGIAHKDLKNARDQYSGDRLIKEATKACENWIEQAKMGDESDRKGLIKALVCMLKQ